MATAVQKASEASQKALATAGRLQLDTTQELNTRMEALLTRLDETLENLEAYQEIIESQLAARESQNEQVNVQITSLIRLHEEMQEMVRVIYEAREQ